MTKEVAIQQLDDLEHTKKLCQSLMSAPFYKKIGPEGIFAIVETARSIGVNPIRALNGGMYYVQGKVELTASMMNELIRSRGHSISKDPKSDSLICILHGKRADNGDTWTESFSIEDAKQAQIYRNQWLKYPRDMLFARALSRLARQLFPDVIRGCYIEGEINEDEQVVEDPAISDAQYQELEKMLEGNDHLRLNYLKRLKSKYGIETLQQMPSSMYEAALNHARLYRKKPGEMLGEEEQASA